MTQKEIIEKRRLTEKLVNNLQIGKAIANVRSMLNAGECRQLLPKLDRDAETFKYLLHYFMEGAEDSDRNRMLNEIGENLLTLADIAEREAKAKDSSEYYFSVLRFADFRKERLSDLIKEYSSVVSEMSLVEIGGSDTSSLRRQKEGVLERLFNSLYTSYADRGAFEELTGYLTSGYADGDIAAMSLSALTLGLLQYYDRYKMDVLLDVFENTEDDRMSARALVGIIFALARYPERIGKDSRITSRMQLWGDSLDSFVRIRQTLRVIIGTRDTERVAHKIKDEVLPELMKLRPQIMEKLSEKGISELDVEAMQDNPEWEELLEKNGLGKKMRELGEMHSEGADFMMVTFSSLKQFPFFNSASNWFLPFDLNHSALQMPDDMKSVVEMMRSAGGLICDSDLYSLALSASRMPEAQRKIISSQLAMQHNQMSEGLKSFALNTSTPGFDIEVQKVVRDLYRFFKLFRKKEDFYDPFGCPIDFMVMPVIGEQMQVEEVLELIGEFYFKRGYYSEALPILQKLVELRKDDATIWEKIGFCCQSNGLLTDALDAYSKAALLRSPGPWLLKKLAFVNRLLGNHEEASEYYRQLLEMDPDNFSVIFNMGTLEIDAGHPEKALQHLYHANYLRPDNLKVLRAIAWAELTNGNFAKSSDYYARVISAGATPADYLNAGHAALLAGSHKEAVNYYRLSSTDRSEEFRNAFMADLPQLMSLGLDRTTALLALEACQL